MRAGHAYTGDARNALWIDAGSFTGAAAQHVTKRAVVTGGRVVITLFVGNGILLAGMMHADGLADVLQLN